MKTIPAVQKYMTMMPHSIGNDQSLDQARDMMTKYRIRHLPVLHGGKIVGILTDRDIKLVMSFKDVDGEKVKVEDACSSDPYITKPDASLNDVCSEMAEHKYGCAIVADNNKLVGIFTEIDALRALAELLTTRLGK